MKRFLHLKKSRIALIVSLSLALLIVLGAIQMARALEVDKDGIIEADEVIYDDVYIEADHVVVDGTVNGILIISAGEAEVNGTVNGDLVLLTAEAKVDGFVADNLFFGGQTLELNGAVEGSVFGGGKSLTLGPSAVVEHNLAFGGFSLETTAGSVVGRDVRTSGYQAILAGQVDQDVVVDSAALEIAGSVGGDVTATVAEPEPEPPLIVQIVFERMQVFDTSTEIAPSGLRVDKEATIEGTLTYKSSVEQTETIESSAIGEVVYEFVPATDQPEPTPAMQFKHWFVAQLQALLTLVVLGALIAWRAPAFLTQPADQVRAKPLPATLWGLLIAFLVIPVGLLVLGVLTLLGILLIVVTLGKLSTAILVGGSSALALAITLFMLFISYGAGLIVSYLIGKLILGRLAPQAAERAVWPLMLGIVLYVPVTSIPCLGAVIHAIAACVSLGAVWLLIYQRRSALEETFGEAAAEIVAETPSLTEE